MPRSQVSERRSWSGSVDIDVGERFAHRDRAVAGQCRPVLRSRDGAVAVLSREVDEHREPGGAVDDGADRGAFQPDDEVAFPVARDGAVVGFGWTFADHHLGCHVRPRLAPSPALSGTRNARPVRRQCDQFTLQRSSALDVERLVDRLMARSAWSHHRGNRPGVDSRSARGSTSRPASIASVRLVPPDPGRSLGTDRDAVGVAHRSRQPILDVRVQSSGSRPACTASGAWRPARPSIVQQTPDTPACRRWSPRSDAVHARPSTAIGRSRERSLDPVVLRTKQRDLLAFSERQVAASGFVQIHRWHSTTATEPTRADRLGHLDRSSRGLARDTPARPVSRTRAPPRDDATDGPATSSATRPVNSCIHPAGLPIIHLLIKVLRRPVESAQYTSWAFTHRARQSGLVPSMGSIGDCYDNGQMESFWARMQVELLNRKRWNTRLELANAIFEYLEIFHNRQRRHSSLGMLSPIEYELRHADNPARDQASWNPTRHRARGARDVIPDTNAIESLNARFRRATRARAHFPTNRLR